ncbi:hypothetical protein [Segatella copri]|uniref:hypothetical protein n=1 Tax=Segatella copri TaxID=165179 RepID=UPI003F715D77
MAKFKIGNYQGIKIDCWTAKDLVGLHHLMKQEGCPNSENLFSDTDKAIELVMFRDEFLKSIMLIRNLLQICYCM